ncbi:hypothetical protein AEAC466_03840 [Asticcacaulis sp. AC466]|uniref:hypothetical protein n=1 Tax=Asticcacaulis sp. AC466 TaxID=1282362 RepID=UPI0003C3D2ED|nr:hypothetical protein [Asticcacaulis sp. AC466]ESQ86341.1 hypothetical protein AEAC466_03840 [Asticcacaulis sp. AC466]
MEFEELIELARESYMGQFVTFADMQAKTHIKGKAEVKFVLEDSDLYRNYYCADYASSEDGNITELMPDEEVSFDPIEVSLEDMDMRVERLQWNDINIKSEPPLTDAELADWFETWFDPDDKTFDPDTRFSGNIHSLTIDGEGIHVDMGTAPLDAFVELLVLYQGLGYSEIRLT